MEVFRGLQFEPDAEIGQIGHCGWALPKRGTHGYGIFAENKGNGKRIEEKKNK